MDAVTSFHSSLVPLAVYGRVGYGLCVDACGLEDYSTRYTTVDDYNGHQHRNYHGEGRKEEFNCLSLLPSLAVRRYRTWIDPAVLLCEEVSKGMSGEGGGLNRRRLPFCSFSCCELLLWSLALLTGAGRWTWTELPVPVLALKGVDYSPLEHKRRSAVVC